MSDDNKEGAGVPVAWEVRNAEISYHAVFATEREARGVADQHDEEGYSQAAVRALYATPPAVMPAAPSDAVSWRHVANEWADMATNAIQHIRNIVDGITKPEAALANLNFCYSHCSEVQSRALSQTMQPQAEPGDPMDWPLPCDVTVGHGTMRKGVTLRTLVNRMKTLYEMATGNDADVVANRTPEERKALADKFLAAIHDKRPLHEQIAEVRRQERPSAEVLNMVVGSSQAEPAAGEQAGAVAYQVHEEDSLCIHATLYAPVLKEFWLEATRDDGGRNWYIEVTDEGGYHTYDGYWRDSHGKSSAEVLAEAVSGSMLDEISAPPQDAIALAAPGAAIAAYSDPACQRTHTLNSEWDSGFEAGQKAAIAAREQFQQRVRPWMMACFGEKIAGDREERNHRFLEEALELVQACGCTASEAHQLVDYTFGRPVGEKAQEVGGVMVTLAALCLAQHLDMHAEGEAELTRIWTMVEKIRAKQAAKPKHSPLPEEAPATPQAGIPATSSETEALSRLNATLGLTNADATIAMANAEVRIRRLTAEATQPTTVQQAEPTDEQLSKAAFKGYDDYWTEDCAGKESEAWLACAKAVLALKTAQTTALPGGNGEGES